MSASAPEIRLSDLDVSIPGRSSPVLNKLELAVFAGEVHGVFGASGSGKTTLMHAISGLIPWHRPGTVGGAIEIAGDTVNDLDPGQRAHLIATCLDRPTSQLFLSTPREELNAAAKQHHTTPLLDHAVADLGLEPLLDRRTTELSSGERQRLTLAAALAACPRPAILDEPLAHLDDSGAAGLMRLLNRAKNTNGTVLLAEQAGWRLGESVSSWSSVENSNLAPANRPAPPVLPRPTHKAGDQVLLTARELTIRRGSNLLIEETDLQLSTGEILLISGPNGAGKSTLAEVLCGFRKPAAGVVDRRGQIALMLPTAELQLFATTVAGEVRSKEDRGAEARVLRRHRLEHLSARPPWSLSRGERQRLVHAALDLQKPAVMVVDEPAQGLGPADLLGFVDLIHRRAERGRAYVIISHREELSTAVHRHFRIDDTRLVPC